MKTYASVLLQRNRDHRDRIALVDRNGLRQTTWSELEKTAKTVAFYAKQNGLQGIVPVRMMRSAEAVAVLLGLNLAGVGAAPLDGKTPDGRCRLIAEETGNAVWTEVDFEKAMREGTPDFADDTQSDEPAIVIFTSGSTGKPKGVLLNNEAVLRGIVRLSGSAFFDYGETDIALQSASFSFVAIILDLFAPMYAGTTVHILPDMARKDAVLMTSYMKKHKISTVFVSPKLLSLLGEVPSLRTVMTGGERLTGFAPTGYRLINGYGMSEMAAVAFGYEVRCAVENTPIGKPADDFVCYLLDENGNLADEGELCVSGPVASGYYNRPEQTNSVFTPNPFSSEPGHEILLHSGDIARRLPDGNYLFLNRKDFMIKINGQRVEPQETEAVFRQECKVDDAVVLGFSEPDGRTYLCAYYVAAEPLDVDAIRATLARKLPSYMIPSYYVRMDGFPLNDNGKLNRFAFVPPSTGYAKNEYVEAFGAWEKELCRAFEKVLHIDRVGAEDEFLYLGGDSVRAMEIVREVPSLQLTADMVLMGKTPRGIAKLRERNRRADATESETNIQSALLTDSQMGIYLQCMVHSDSIMYNIPMHFAYPRTTQTADQVKRAVDTVLASHGALYACLQAVEDAIRMCRCPFPADGICTVEECDNLDIQAQYRSFVQPFSLFKSPLCRVRALLTADVIHILFDCHHIVADGTSVSLLARRFGERLAGKEIEPEFSDAFSVYQTETVTEEELAESKTYFETLLGDAETENNLLFDTVPNEKTDNKTSYADISLRVPHIKPFLRRYGLTESSFFMGAFGYTLAKMNGQTESLFAAAESGRKDSRWDNTVLMFVRTLPVRMRLDETKTSSEFLSEGQSQFHASVSHDRCSFGELCRTYGINADVMFVYQSDMLSFAESVLGKAEITPIPVGEGFTNLACSVYKHGDTYTVNIGYRDACYNITTIERFLAVFQAVCVAFAGNAVLQEIALLPEKDRILLDEHNNTESTYADGETFVDAFRRTARKYPDKTAVVCREKRYSYRETDILTDRIASYLLDKGIDRGNTVSVLVKRNEYMVLASVGILKTGAIYQPLDSTYPAERLSFMCKDADSKLLIADRELVSLLPEYTAPILFTDEIASLPETESACESPVPEDGFVLLYTSGTTGQPKGCKLTHRNLTAYFHAYHVLFDTDETCVAGAYAGFGFDAHTSELYPMLTVGGTVHIITEELRLDFPALKAYFEKNGITHTVMTTQIARQFVAEYPRVEHLRHILSGGEKMTLTALPETYKLTNGYGPSEATVMVTCFTPEMITEDISIGKALPNVKLYITDAVGRRVPFGVPGELWVSGPQVSDGYLNREEKTKEVFIANPFDKKDGYGMIYKTGDIVRLTADGNLSILGRRDMQVKIRGFRIELSEVETVLRAYPAVSDAVVIAVDNPAGGKCLHAYIVADAQVDTADLNRFIAATKPPYMVPAATMQIDRIPLTPNFKVDKRKLPPITVLPEYKENGPRILTDLEQKLYDILREIVGDVDFSVTTDFVSAGVTSISSIRLAVRIYKEFGLHITSKEILDGSTILSVENGIMAALTHNRTSSEDTATVPDETPLTQTQIGIYTDCLKNGTDVYNIPVLLKLKKDTDIPRLQNAIKQAVQAHPSMLCHIYADEKGNAAIHAVPDMAIRIEEETVSSLAVTPTHFVFEKAPLFRFRILHFENDVYLLTELHHIIADGESLRILLEDIHTAYRGITLTPEPFTSRQLSVEEQKARRSEAFISAETYYDSVFRGVSADYLPCADRKEKSVFGQLDVCIDRDKAVLQSFCEKNNIAESILFNGAFAVTLARFTAHEDAVYATLHNGRGDPRTERLVTMAAKTLPFSIQTKADTPVGEFLRKVSDRLHKLIKYDLYSFADAAGKYGVSAEPMFIYQGELMSEIPLGKRIPMETTTENARAKTALSVEVNRTADGYRLHCEYDAGRYSTAWVDGFLDAYAQCVAEMPCRETLGDIDICSEKARTRFVSFNDTAWPVPYQPAYRLFEESVARHPDKTAVVAGDETLTYRQLDCMANDLARSLCSLGMQTNASVEILLGRTKEIYISQLGILKSGNAFLYLSPDYPDERIRFISEDARAQAIVTTHPYAEARKDLLQQLDIPVLYVDDIATDTTATPLSVPTEPDALAYLIFTSGSTGKPKGVTVTQKGLCNVTHRNPKNTQFPDFANDNTVNTAVTAFTFDASVVEGFISLASGSTVCIASEDEIHNPVALCAMCRKNGVTSMLGTPSFILNLTDCEAFAEVARQLQTVIAGGEAFTEVLLERLTSLHPGLRIINGYGPSEATIACSSKTLTRGEPITIGKPLANCELYCLDNMNRILPMGALGELTVLGDNVGNGYLHRDDLTKKAFITVNGKRAFRTGDLAVITHDGEVEFHGRTDNQVKIRGLRVELGEIEQVMNTVPGMHTAVVVVKGENENRYLAAFYTAEREIPSEEIINIISQKLAKYMVPRVFMQLDTMPMTANGKIDRKALPDIRTERKQSGTEAVNGTEKMLCELFASVLQTEKVYADDDFFAVGGNSLAASRVVMQLQSKGCRVEYQTIFDCPTPQSLARFIGDGANPEKKKVSFADIDNPTDASLRETLRCNAAAYADRVTRTALGDVLLTGAVGFLGMHVLSELLQSERGHIYCLVRKGRFDSPYRRLDAVSFYYFGQCLCEAYADRITVLDADITNENLSSVLKKIRFDTVINCAAVVRHFSADDSIEFVNVHGVENLIAVSKEKNAKMIQISTTSVAGVHTEETLRKHLRLHENQLFTADNMDNKYLISKYHAEVCMLQAVREGLRGKIIRVGNLMGRHCDGEFQMNMRTNAFLNALKGFTVIGKSPIGHCTDPMEFSPVDCTAKAIVTLAGTDDIYTVFHANNRFSFDEMQLIYVCNRCGLPIEPIDDKDYYKEYTKLLGDSSVNKYLSALVTNDRPGVHSVEVNNRFSANVLYRLGFAWPFMDNAYLERVITKLKTIGFFDRDFV